MNQLQDGASKQDLHSAIMNIPCCPYRTEPEFVMGYKFGHRDARHAAADLALSAISATPAAPEPANHLGNLLAVIHGDGGHYQDEHGTEKAVEDAIAKWHAASQPAEAVGKTILLDVLSRMPRDTSDMERNQPGFHHAEGWNAALRQLMDYAHGGSFSGGTQSPPAAPAVGGVLMRNEFLELVEDYAGARVETALFNAGVDRDGPKRMPRPRLKKVMDAYAALSAQAPAPEVAQVRAVEQQPNEVQITHPTPTEKNAGTLMFALADSLLSVANAFPGALGVQVLDAIDAVCALATPAQATQGGAEPVLTDAVEAIITERRASWDSASKCDREIAYLALDDLRSKLKYASRAAHPKPAAAVEPAQAAPAAVVPIAGLSTLRNVIETLRATGSYSDEEGEATNHLAELLAQQAAAVPEGWQPIATAPTDVLVIVGWRDESDPENPDRHMFDYLEEGVWQNYFNEHEHYAIAGVAHGNSEDAPYTHWMRLDRLAAKPTGKEQAS